MLFFKDFEKLTYRFGNEETTTVIQDLSTYSSVIDELKDDISFYEYVTIPEGFRPDQMSIYLYDTPVYYWSFYLLNDNIRLQGWPLDNDELDVKIKKQYPNTVITTKDDLTGIFKVGRTVVGTRSGSTGTILHRNLELGQLVIEGDLTFNLTPSPEAVTSTFDSPGGTTVETITISATSEEYNAAHHYVDGTGAWTDIDPSIGPGALLTEVTNYEYYYNENEALRNIKAVKPNLVSKLVSSYKRSIRG